MVGDLKKFGLPNINNLKIDTLRPGYGEVVCQLIDELVNLELYRRDFEFRAPNIPNDDENSGNDDYGDEANQEEQFQGRNEIINGIEIQTHSLTSPGGLITGSKGSSKAPKRKGNLLNSEMVKGEETKMNFFDPYSDN